METIDRQLVLEGAKELFWELGYDWTGIDALELRTGVGRTALHGMFGSKRDLLDAVLEDYAGSFIAPRLAGMEAVGASIDAVVEFFRGLATWFRQDPVAHRGCLMVNAIGELIGHDTLGAHWGSQFEARLASAFRNALSGAPGRDRAYHAAVDGRCTLLVAQTLGLWLLVRIDPLEAAQAGESVLAEISGW